MKINGVISAFLACAAMRALGVEPGEPAPALDGVAGWIFGAPVAPAASTGTAVRVFILFATDSAPSRDAMSRIGQWQERYKNRGVVFAGIANATEDALRAFAQSSPPPFPVAMDPERRTNATWWKGVVELPTAIVIGADGRIAWKGYALDGLQDQIEAMLEPAAPPAAPPGPPHSSLTPAAPVPAAEFDEQLTRLLADNNYDEVMRRIEEKLKENPRQPALQRLKAGMLVQSDNPEAYREQCAAMRKLAEGSADDLNDLAWMMVQPSALPLKYLDPALALETAETAVRLSERKDSAMLDTLAHAFYRAGRIADALAATREAIALVPANAPEELAELKGAAEFFERILAMNVPAAVPAATEPAPATPPPAAQPDPAATSKE